MIACIEFSSGGLKFQKPKCRGGGEDDKSFFERGEKVIAGVSLEAFDVGNPNSAHVSCSPLLELIVTHSFLFFYTHTIHTAAIHKKWP